MYFRVAKQFQESLLREIRRGRLRASVLYFPVLLLIFLGVGAALVFLKEHIIIEMLRRALGEVLSERAFWPLIWTLVTIVAMTALIFFLRQIYRECAIEDHLFCEPCKAVDSDETGRCPICARALSERAEFFYTNYDDEKKLLARRGLQEYRKE